MPTYEIKGPDGKTYEIDGPKGATREQVISAIQAKLSASKPEAKPEPKTRNVAAVLNDTVISVANAALGGAQAAADFVSPGSSFSKAVDELIKKGEESQSDMVKAGREEFQRNLTAAETTGEEVGAVAKYVAQNPLQAAAQAAGSFAGPGLAIKGATKASQMLNLAEKTAERLGLGTGIVTNAAMAGGDAGGSAYKMVMDTPDEILLQNDYIRSQVEKGIPLEKVKKTLRILRPGVRRLFLH